MADMLAPIVEARDVATPEYAAALMAAASRFISADPGNRLTLGSDDRLFADVPASGPRTWAEATGTWAQATGTWAEA